MRFGLTTSFIDGALAVPAVSGVAEAKCARSRAEKFQRATVRRDMCAAAPAKGTSTPFPASISLTPCVHAALVRGVCLVRDARSCPCEALGGKLSLSARIGAWDMQFALERVAAAAGLRQRVQLVPFVTAPEVVDMCDQLPFWCPNRSCTRTPKNMASLTTFCHTAGAYRVPYMAFRSLPIRPPRGHLDTQWSRDGALQRSKFDVQHQQPFQAVFPRARDEFQRQVIPQFALCKLLRAQPTPTLRAQRSRCRDPHMSCRSVCHADLPGTLPRTRARETPMTDIHEAIDVIPGIARVDSTHLQKTDDLTKLLLHHRVHIQSVQQKVAQKQHVPNGVRLHIADLTKLLALRCWSTLEWASESTLRHAGHDFARRMHTCETLLMHSQFQGQGLQ